jgi:hypothetical protein
MSDPSIQATPPVTGPAPLSTVELSTQGTRTFLSVLPFTITWMAIHALLCCGVVAFLIGYIPRAERVFRDFNMKLPAATELTVVVARWLANYWYVLPPFGFLWLILAGALLGALRQRHRSLGWLWALLLLLLPLLVGVFAFFAVVSPYVKLLDGLSR